MSNLEKLGCDSTNGTFECNFAVGYKGVEFGFKFIHYTGTCQYDLKAVALGQSAGIGMTDDCEGTHNFRLSAGVATVDVTTYPKAVAPPATAIIIQRVEATFGYYDPRSGWQEEKRVWDLYTEEGRIEEK